MLVYLILQQCIESSSLIRTNLHICVYIHIYIWWSAVWIYVCSLFMFCFFLSLFSFFCSNIEKNLSRKQTSPLVDSSSTIVRSRVFIFMRRTPLNGKFERKEQEQEEEDEEGEKVRYWRRTSEQGGGSSECSVILFCVRICVFVVARSTVILIVCTAKKKERKRRGKKKNDEQEYTHTYCSKTHWTTTTYGRDACVQRTSSCQR